MLESIPEPRPITQRELRNDSGEIMRQLDQGEAFVVTRNGTPVAELLPLRRRRFVSAEAAVAASTLAELAAGPHATTDPHERARRQGRLQRAEATFDALPLYTRNPDGFQALWKGWSRSSPSEGGC